MTVGSPPENTTASVEYWKARCEKLRFMITSMTSLLNRYGNSIDLEQLYSAFLLTLMGQLLSTDACYYCYDTSSEMMKPAAAYGRFRKDNLPDIPLSGGALGEIRRIRMPQAILSAPPALTGIAAMQFFSRNFNVIAPLFLKEKLVGMLFLGDKISKQPFKPLDFDVLYALCAVSAAAFNNAILYENAKHSVQEVQRLQEIRNDVINRVTHEFRTPLTIIKAGVELLSKNPEYEELAGMFVDSEQRLEDLINSLLSLSQKTQPGVREDRRIDPVDLLHQSIYRFAQAAADKHIHVAVHHDPDLAHPVLHMGEEEFRMVVDALIENAIKFSPAGSGIRIETGRGRPMPDRDGLQLPDWRAQVERTIREYQASDLDGTDLADGGYRTSEESIAGLRSQATEYFVVRFADHGIGIPAQDLMLVTEPFRQASNSPDIGVKGKGLGLALAHKNVTRCGGYLCCKSTEGEGTTFSVFLPLAPSHF